MQNIIKKDYTTKHRKFILDLLKENQGKKFTADEIIHLINKEEVIISKATVYRNLDYLFNKGLIKKINLDNICSCYIYNKEKCVNFCCDKCGEVTQISSRAFDALNHKLSKEFHFLIDQSKTIIHGTCYKCQEAHYD